MPTEGFVNDWTSQLASALPAGSGPGAVVAVVDPFPDAAVTAGVRLRLRVGLEVVLADVTAAGAFTVVDRAVEDADRFPASTWEVGTRVKAVLTAAGVEAVAAAGAAGAGVTGNTLWVDAVNGNDGTGTRGRADKPFLTLTAAKTAALAGDLIHVRPGTYNERNLLKNGVDWHFEAGATVHYTGTANGGVFDDSVNGSNGPVVCRISGRGEFRYATTTTAYLIVANDIPHPYSCVSIGNSGSVVAIDAARITAEWSDAANRNSVLAVDHYGGTLTVEADEIAGVGQSATSGVWWRNGGLRLRAKRIAGHYPIYNDVRPPMTGEGYFDVEVIESLSSSGSFSEAAITMVALGGGDPTLDGRAWVRVQEIIAGAYGVIQSAGKLYLMGVGKLSAALQALQVTGNSQFWGDFQKVTIGAGGGCLMVPNAASGRSSYLQVQQIEGLAASVAYLVRLANGTRCVADAITMAAGNLLGVDLLQGGEFSGTVDATLATTGNPVNLSASGGTLRDAVLIAATGRDAISASTPQTVAIAGTLTANTAPNANVTRSGGPLVRSDTGEWSHRGPVINQNAAGTVTTFSINDAGTVFATGQSFQIGSGQSAPTSTQAAGFGRNNVLSGTGANLFALGSDNTVGGTGTNGMAVGCSNTISGAADTVFCYGISNTIAGGNNVALIGNSNGSNGRTFVYAMGNNVQFSGCDFAVGLGTNPVVDTNGSLAFGGYVYDPTFELQKLSSTSVSRKTGALVGTWATSTDASRTGRISLVAYSVTTAQEGVRVEANAGGVRLGFFGGAAVAKPAVTGSRGGNAALASLLTQLAALGLITDSTTA